MPVSKVASETTINEGGKGAIQRPATQAGKQQFRLSAAKAGTQQAGQPTSEGSNGWQGAEPKFSSKQSSAPSQLMTPSPSTPELWLPI